MRLVYQVENKWHFHHPSLRVFTFFSSIFHQKSSPTQINQKVENLPPTQKKMEPSTHCSHQPPPPCPHCRNKSGASVVKIPETGGVFSIQNLGNWMRKSLGTPALQKELEWIMLLWWIVLFWFSVIVADWNIHFARKALIKRNSHSKPQVVWCKIVGLTEASHTDDNWWVERRSRKLDKSWSCAAWTRGFCTRYVLVHLLW